MSDDGEFYFDPAAPLDDNLLPDGWRKAVVSDAFYEETEKGKRIKVILEIKDADKPGVFVEDLFCIGYYNPKAVWFGKQKLQSLCIAAGKQKAFRFAKDLIGAEAKVLIGHSEWRGKEKNKVEEYACIALTPSSTASRQKENGTVSNHGARKLYTQEDFPAPPPLSADDDNIPF